MYTQPIIGYILGLPEGYLLPDEPYARMVGLAAPGHPTGGLPVLHVGWKSVADGLGWDDILSKDMGSNRWWTFSPEENGHEHYRDVRGFMARLPDIYLSGRDWTAVDPIRHPLLEGAALCGLFRDRAHLRCLHLPAFETLYVSYRERGITFHLPTLDMLGYGTAAVLAGFREMSAYYRSDSDGSVLESIRGMFPTVTNLRRYAGELWLNLMDTNENHLKTQPNTQPNAGNPD